jgi:hypothetical protein
MRKLLNFIVCFILVFLLNIWISCSQVSVPVNYQTDLISKILLMNKNFTVNGKQIKIGILYNGLQKSSADIATQLSSGLTGKGIRINNKKIDIQLIDLSQYNNRQIIDVLKSSDLSCLYISPVRGVNLANISRECKDNNILSITATPSQTETYFTIGFDIIDNQIKIIINYQNMIEENVDFSSYLLKVAKIINE